MINSMVRAYRAYRLDLIVNRATLGKVSVDELCDDELIALHRDLHRALDCVRNDVPFEHAGLIDVADASVWMT